MEAQYALKNKKLVDLSAQDLIDCSGELFPFNRGCRGGEIMTSLRYIETDGISFESDYPYEGIDGACRRNKSKLLRFPLKNVGIIDNETALQRTLCKYNVYLNRINIE